MSEPLPPDWQPGDPLFVDVPLFGICEVCGTTWIDGDDCPECEASSE
jgi:rubrerythrin